MKDTNLELHLPTNYTIALIVNRLGAKWKDTCITYKASVTRRPDLPGHVLLLKA